MTAARKGLTLQEIVAALQKYWADRGCLIHQPWDAEVGAGTMHPETFLRVLGPDPWKVAYVQPSRRPADGRYGENPFRLYKHQQLQVVLKPPPADIQDVYLGSLVALGIDPAAHDVRFEEDNWESPALGAWGIGWQVLLDGQEITQFTYFQQAGGYDLNPITAEITYGIERIACYLQGVERIMDLRWSAEYTWSDLFLKGEVEWCFFNFEHSNPPLLFELFEKFEAEAVRLLKAGLVLPGYDYVVKCSHVFNLLEARGAISVTERVATVARVRKMARLAAGAYLKQREEMGYPLLRGAANVA